MTPNEERRCVGCGLAAEPGDVCCTGCREGIASGSNPGDWPEPLTASQEQE